MCVRTHAHSKCRARRLVSICFRVHPVQSQTHSWRSAALNRLHVRCRAVCDFLHLMTKLLSLPPSPGGSLVVMVTSINTPAKLSGPPRLPLLLPPIPVTVTEDWWHVITAGDTSRKRQIRRMCHGVFVTLFNIFILVVNSRISSLYKSLIRGQWFKVTPSGAERYLTSLHQSWELNALWQHTHTIKEKCVFSSVVKSSQESHLSKK